MVAVSTGSRRLTIGMNQLRWILSVCALAVSAGAVAQPPEANEGASLTVSVSGARSDKGRMRFALYDSAETFTREAIKGGMSPIKEGKAEWRIASLPPGRYAVALYHDENGDGKFNQNFIGIPKEDYAFSRNAKVRLLRPPSWKSVVFTVEPGTNRHAIKIR